MKKLIDIDDSNLDELRVLLSYYKAKNNLTKITEIEENIGNIIDSLIKRYENLFKNAIKAKNTQWAQELVSEIKRLHPRYEKISQLEKQLST